jgi:signal transduction histidine kinase
MPPPTARFLAYFLPAAAALASLVAVFHAHSLVQERRLHEARARRAVELDAAAVGPEPGGPPETAASGLPGDLMLLDGDGRVLHGPTRGSFPSAHPEAWARILGAPQGSVVLPEGLFHFKALPPEARGGSGPARAVYFAAPDKLYAASRKRLAVLLALGVPVLAGLAGLLRLLCRAQEDRRLQEKRCWESEGRLRALAARLIETQERERKNLSRELHDDVGQLLSLMCLELDRSLSPDGRASRPEVVQRALEGARQALDRVRALCGSLRPPVLDDLGLKEAARSLLEQVRAKTGIALESELSLDSRAVPPAVGENVYRILQEAVTNVARHAGPTRGRVTLLQTGDALELVVEDWGVGFEPGRAGTSSMGLLSMRERAQLLGGTFNVRSEPGRGTRVSVAVPIKASGAARGRA